MDNISDRDISHLNTYVQYALYGKKFSFLFVFLYKVKHNAAWKILFFFKQLPKIYMRVQV